MNCSWKEEEAQRFAEGTLDPERQAAFAGHLAGCQACRARVAEAERLEGLLQAGITPVAAPATLASRVANALAAEREERQARRGLRLVGRRLSPLLVGVAAALVLAVASYAVAPGAVMALAQRVLFFVPGLGIKPTGEGTLVAAAPVSVQLGDTTFTVEALLSDGERTTVKFSVTGLPGGKTGWDSKSSRPEPPVLRDSTGREYAMVSGHQGVGGSPESNKVDGTAFFQPLPADLQSIDVVMPMAYVVPPSVLPGADQKSWVAHIALMPPDQSGLPAATPQSAETTLHGITLRAAATAVEARQTVVLVEAEAQGEAQVRALSRSGRNPVEAAVLHDAQGREYKLQPRDGASMTFGSEFFRRDLYFAPLARGAGQLTLTVPVMEVEEKGAVDITIPLAGRGLGETFALDHTVDLGGYPVVLKSATLAASDAPWEQGRSWLYIDVELGDARDGRTLAGFRSERRGGSAAMQSFGKDDGAQVDRFGVPVEEGETEVTITLEAPVVIVEGPWEVSFPAAQ